MSTKIGHDGEGEFWVFIVVLTIVLAVMGLSL